MPNWEDSFQSWAKGPSATEQAKCENAETAVRKAIIAHTQLSSLDITVFVQGSYKNRTNVRQDSDVDLCVRLNSTFFSEYPAGKTREDYGHIAGSITYADFRNFVQRALEDYFGKEHVIRGNKAFDIHANSYRVDADVVAALLFKRYDAGQSVAHEGIAFDPDTGPRIRNWPEQNFTNSSRKHTATGRRFRKIVRIPKHLRNRMQDEKVAGSAGVASCLIEHLVWNVPTEKFGHPTLSSDVREILACTFNATLTDEACTDWAEVNDLQYLFRGIHPWTREQAHGFISAAWDYLGLQ